MACIPPLTLPTNKMLILVKMIKDIKRLPHPYQLLNVSHLLPQELKPLECTLHVLDDFHRELAQVMPHLHTLKEGQETSILPLQLMTIMMMSSTMIENNEYLFLCSVNITSKERIMLQFLFTFCPIPQSMPYALLFLTHNPMPCYIWLTVDSYRGCTILI